MQNLSSGSRVQAGMVRHHDALALPSGTTLKNQLFAPHVDIFRDDASLASLTHVSTKHHII